MKPINCHITLRHAFMLSPHVKHFVFDLPDDTCFDFKPGQFINIYFEQGGKTLQRSYSLANLTPETNQIEFAAGFVKDGPATELLFNLTPGETLEMRGALGRLVLAEEHPKRYILIGTSTGITPYRTMLNDLRQRLTQNPLLSVVILQGVQTREDVLYETEFLEFSKQHENAHYISCLSREKKPLTQHEFSGYVQQYLATLNPKPQDDMIYLCGNPSMIDETQAQLNEQGFTPRDIFREKYIRRT